MKLNSAIVAYATITLEPSKPDTVILMDNCYMENFARTHF